MLRRMNLTEPLSLGPPRAAVGGDCHLASGLSRAAASRLAGHTPRQNEPRENTCRPAASKEKTRGR